MIMALSRNIFDNRWYMDLYLIQWSIRSSNFKHLQSAAIPILQVMCCKWKPRHFLLVQSSWHLIESKSDQEKLYIKVKTYGCPRQSWTWHFLSQEEHGKCGRQSNHAANQISKTKSLGKGGSHLRLEEVRGDDCTPVSIEERQSSAESGGRDTP